MHKKLLGVKIFTTTTWVGSLAIAARLFFPHALQATWFGNILHNHFGLASQA